MACEICGNIPQEKIIWENRDWVLFLSDDQSYLARSIVACKRHCPSLSDISNAEWESLLEAIQKYETAASCAFHPTNFNWSCLMNNAYQEEKPQSHVYWHVRPRYKKPLEVAGISFADPEFGKHYDPKKKKEVSPKVEQEIIAQLKAGM